MSYINPVNHPESYLSGSTVESMVNRCVDLGMDYFAISDHNSLTSVLKAYKYAKDKNIKVIAGVELFFKDQTCEIVKGTESERFKYSKVVVHAKDQKAYQALVRLVSDRSRPSVMIEEENYGLYGWKDLEKLSEYNVTVTTANVEDIVTKHLLVGREDLSHRYFDKMLSIFGDNYYPAIVAAKQDKYWSSLVVANVGGANIEIPADSVVETDKWKTAKAYELADGRRGHKKLKSLYLNNMLFKIKKDKQDINSASIENKFKDIKDVQLEANHFILKKVLDKKMLDRLLVSSYAYYSHEGDKVVQDMKLGEEKRVYQHQHIMDTSEINNYLIDEMGLDGNVATELEENTREWAIANFSNFKLDYDYRLPVPEGDPEKLLIQRIKEMGRMNWEDERYTKQLKEEFELLTGNGVINLIPYFLPIIDIYDYYAKNGHLTGPARGSAGGFLISYLIGITHVDPIKYGLSSSRFLTLDRVQSGNLPDIDCDLESRIPLVGKDGNSGYLFNKYGKKAAQVSTRTLLRIKSAILDANRFMNGGKVEADITALSKSLPNTPQGVNDQDFVFGYEDNDGNHVEGLLELNDDLQIYATERPKEWDIVKRALSMSRQHSRHACAYVISDEDIEETVPIMEVGGVKRVTQPEHKDCEVAGLIKYDFLVVSSLKDINLCLKYINKKNKDLDMETGYFNHNDEKTYVWDLPVEQDVFKMLWQGKTETVFQLNSVTATPLVKDIKPESVIDCAVITSLGRPGPLDFKDPKTGRNMAQEYAFRKRGQSKSDLPILNELLPETYGVLVFQEQVTKLAKDLAGMNVEDSENVRIAVGKKKKKLIDSLKPIFIEGAAKKVDIKTAEQIWDMMETFARYGFNKSHAVAYSVISYACAYLKHHYPLEWWAAVLSNATDKEINEVFYKYVKDMVLPPDVNTSTEQMEIDYSAGKIRNKLSVISGLGKNYAEKIMAGRPYTSLKDFVEKDTCGPSLARKLIYVGALDSLFPEGLEDLTKISMYEETVAEVEFLRKMKDKREKIEALMREHEEGKIEYSKVQRAINTAKRAMEKGPKKPSIPEEYVGINSKKAFQIKKSVFPTMNLDLNKALIECSDIPVFQMESGSLIVLNNREYRLMSGEHLQFVDNNNMQEEVTFCVPGYVIDVSEFPYQRGARKALKVIVDSSGYLSEKVIWPDYNTGELSYDPEIKKGAIVYFLYNKKPNKPYTNIRDTFVEEKTIIT